MGRAWSALSSSLWFVPGTIVGMSLLLAMILIEASTRVDVEALARFPRLFGAGAAGARDMLSTIAGSVITVAGVTFSITIAALALASAQYTPRVLRTFMADRANQVVLGSFVGIFAYCLVVLRTIRGGDEGAFVPSIAVLGGVMLALLGVGLLVFFIHHIAEALQVSTILERIRTATESAVVRLFPSEVAEPAAGPSEGDVLSTAPQRYPLRAHGTGYLQHVDADTLVALAREHGVVVHLDVQVGDFIVPGTTVAHVACDAGPGSGRTGSSPGREGLMRKLAPCFTIARNRTVEQDAGFGILQIVDIALKALSPGVNDTTTAVSCVHHLGALLACLAPRELPPRVRGADAPRLVARGPTFTSLVSLALDDVRRNADGNVRVIGALYDAIANTARRSSDPHRRTTLASHLSLMDDVTHRSVLAPVDRQLLQRRSDAVRRLLDDATGTSKAFQ